VTRCDAFWRKIATIREDKEAMNEFCEKQPRTVASIVSHSRYLERHADKLGMCTKVQIDELSARPLRKLERQNPDLHDAALELVCGLEKPTANEVKAIVARIADAPEFMPKIYDIWSFGARDPRYGQADYKWGLICGQIVENLLHYYTEPGDFILDPMAGGGTTIDVCKAFDRTCIAFDIEPVRGDIFKHDITTGPPQCDPCPLVILEPPYYNMKQDAYGSQTEYREFLRLAIRHSVKKLLPGGYLALIVMDQVNKDKEKVPIIGPSYRFLELAGLKYEHLVGLPLTTEQHTAYHVERAKREKIMLGINRQMWIFRRPGP